MMNARETIDQFIQQIGNDMGADMKLGEDGFVSLQLDNEHEFSIFTPEQSDRVLLHSTICTVAKDQMADFTKKAMSLNAQPMQVGGGAVGFDEDQQALIFTRTCNTQHLSFESFEDMLDDYTNALRGLPTMFAGMHKEDDGGSDEENWVKL